MRLWAAVFLYATVLNTITMKYEVRDSRPLEDDIVVTYYSTKTIAEDLAEALNSAHVRNIDKIEEWHSSHPGFEWTKEELRRRK